MASTTGRINFPLQPVPLRVKKTAAKFSDENVGVNRPNNIFSHVDYKKKGEAELPKTYQKVVAYIEKSFDIPEDFEISSSYGVHSGSCYERRLIAAFAWGQLNPKKGVQAQKMCVECGEMGHFRDDCEELIKQ